STTPSRPWMKRASPCPAISAAAGPTTITSEPSCAHPGRLEMAYNLIGKNFTPADIVAKVTGRAKYAEDFRADGMVFCKTLPTPNRALQPRGGPKTRGVAGRSPRGRRAELPAAAAADPRQGRDALRRRADPRGRRRNRGDRGGGDRSDQDRLRAAGPRHRSL